MKIEGITISDERPTIKDLGPFFSGWTWTPTEEANSALIENSDVIFVARNEGSVVGFVTALTDGGFFAYLSYLEVLPEFQGKGVAKALVKRVIERVETQYDLATITDAETVPFYKSVGFENNVAGVHLRFLPRKNL